jgi:hypothetical protein
VADAYREWSKVARIPGEFPPSAPPEPESVDQVAKRVEQQYHTAAKRFIERLEAVVSGLAEGITKGGFVGEIK